MKKDMCCYEEFLAVFLQETEYDFVKDNGKMDSATQSSIGLISAAYQRSVIEVKDALVDMALKQSELETKDNERQYAHIDMYGEDNRLST